MLTYPKVFYLIIIICWCGRRKVIHIRPMCWLQRHAMGFEFITDDLLRLQCIIDDFLKPFSPLGIFMVKMITAILIYYAKRTNLMSSKLNIIAVVIVAIAITAIATPVLAQNLTGGNMTGGNMTGGNMTGGNMTGGNATTAAAADTAGGEDGDGDEEGGDGDEEGGDGDEEGGDGDEEGGGN
jgi:hypothetical protein